MSQKFARGAGCGGAGKVSEALWKSERPVLVGISRKKTPEDRPAPFLVLQGVI